MPICQFLQEEELSWWELVWWDSGTCFARWSSRLILPESSVWECISSLEGVLRHQEGPTTQLIATLLNIMTTTLLSLPVRHMKYDGLLEKSSTFNKLVTNRVRWVMVRVRLWIVLAELDVVWWETLGWLAGVSHSANHQFSMHLATVFPMNLLFFAFEI